MPPDTDHIKQLGSVNQFDTEADARVFAERAEALLKSTIAVVVVRQEENGRWLVLQRLAYLSREGEHSYAMP